MGLRASSNNRAQRKSPAEKRIPESATSLTGFWLRGVLGVALATFLAVTAGVFAWVKNENANRLRQLDGYSGMIAHDVEKRVASLQGLLHGLETEPRLVAAFSSQSRDKLRDEEARLVRLVSSASQVRLLKPGACKGKELQAEPFSYAGLDLLCQAEMRRDVTLLEVHRLGSPEKHLAIAAPVLNAASGTLLGVIHVALSPSLLPSLEDAHGEWGSIAFQQMVEDKAVTLSNAGDTAVPKGLPDHQLPIEGTRLDVAGWVGNGGVLDAKLLLWATAAYLVLTALILLAMWLPLSAIRRALVKDYGGVVALVEDAMNRNPLRHLQCRLAETKLLVEALSGPLKRMRPTRATEPPLPDDQGPVAEEQAGAAGEAEAEGQAVQTRRTMGKAASEGLAAGELGLPSESIPDHVFRAQDISGVLDQDLTVNLLYALGLAVGTEAAQANYQTVIVGRDTRPSSQELSKSLVMGLLESGRDVLDLGIAPTPLVYFATCYRRETFGAMITSSHNSESYNGLRVLAGGATLTGKRIEGLRERILGGLFSSGQGDYRVEDLVADYVGQVELDVAVARRLKVVVHCGNAAVALVAPRLYQALGCDPVEFDYEPEMGVPGGRVPDPTSPESLEVLQHAVVDQGADLGLAFDGDGSRIGVVDSSGKTIWTDRVLMLLVADVLSRHPGTDVVYDATCSGHLATEILRHGGRPVMCRSGDAFLEEKLRETGALLAGGWSGHILFQERWYGFADALYAGARLLEVLALDPRSSAEVFAELPEAAGTPELILDLAKGESAQIMKAVAEEAARTTGFDLSTEEGLRVESEAGWGYVRASDSGLALVFRFEAEDDAELSEIQDLFRQILVRAAPGLQLPF